MTEFFKNLNDNDFFSNKLTHIYLYGRINEKSVDKLINDIRDANKIKEENDIKILPKPILIHINSKGGSVYDAMRFLTIFKISSVPIATIIDNYSFSSATFLSIHSPYRVMTKYSYCLLHYYIFSGYIELNRDKLFSRIKEFETYFKNICDMYLKKTKFNKFELDELLQHDLYLDYKYCLKKGIVDRVIDYNYPSSLLSKIDIFQLIKNDNTIHINLLPCNNDDNNLDFIIRKNNDLSTPYPIIIYPINNICNEETLKKSYLPSNIPSRQDNSFLIENKDFNILHNLNFINKIKAINGIKIAIIDIPISIDYILPLLFTNKIYMYSHSFIICNLLYFKNPVNNILLDDTIKNYKTIYNKIKTILKQKTKMTLSNISNINKKFIIIHPNEALKIGLCNEIIYT